MRQSCFAAFLILLSPIPLQGQRNTLFDEVSFVGSVADSNNPEFPSPVGFGVRSTWNIRPQWLFRLSYHRITDESHKTGLVCRSYAPHIICRPTVTDNTVTLVEVRGGLLRTVVLGGHLRLGFGGGLSFNNLSASSKADDGRRADLLAPKTGQVGYLALLSADLIIHPSIPVRLTGGLTNNWIHFHTCSGSNPPQYDPFCELAQIRELELGLTLAF